MYMRKNNLRTAFTIVELMVVMVLLLVITAALVPQLRAVRSSWATTQKSSELIQNALVLEEHLNRNLAAAKQILKVSAADTDNGFITFTDNLGVSKTYSVSSGYISFGDTANPQTLAGPVTKFKISCYSLNNFDTPITDVNSIRFVKIETDLASSEQPTASRSFVTQIYLQTGRPSATGQEVIDVMISSNNRNTAYDFIAGDYGCDAVMDISQNNYQAMLCFKDIIGDANGQIPQGTKISEAKLKLWYVNHNGNRNIYIYRMNVKWDETSTWNSIGGGIRPGVNCDSASVLTLNPGNGVPTSLEIDVTDIVKGWVNGEYQNYGFGFVNDRNNNLQFAASENTTGTNAHTPKLIVKQQTPDTRPKVAVKSYVDYGGGNAFFDSYNSGSGVYGNSNVSANAVVTANAIGYGIITLYSGGTIYGDAYIGPGGNITNGFSTWGSTITGTRGTLDKEIYFPNPTAPTGSPFDNAPEGDFPTNDWTGGERIINSNRHFNSLSLWSSYITINGDVTILLEGDLNVGSGRSIRIAPGSSLNLYVKGNCGIGGSLNAYNQCLPSNLRIYMLGGNNSFSTWGNGNIYAMLDNPNGAVSFWGSGAFFGRIKAKSLSGSCPIHVDLDSAFENGGGSAGENRTWTFTGGNTYQGIAP